MAILSSAATNLMLTEFVNLANSGTAVTNSYIELRTAPIPANPINPATGNLLVTVNMSEPAVTGPNNEILTLQFAEESTRILMTGTVAWFRCYNKDNVAIFDGTVTLSGHGGDIEIDSINFIGGGNVTIENTTMRFFCT